MFYQYPNNDEVLFTINNANEQSIDVKQYCHIEHVMLTSAMPVTPKVSIKFRMELTVCHLLQGIYNWLSIIINRLTADIEQSGKVHRQIS